ncbi:M48 family metallopeptidase [Patescibacteria group bacterium]|nr:M48 family metallopeptidase [Patescibacteria group bacterium]MCL5733309.1 M48 family metallopeptidase [Patescibacteria group bacterium]
MNLYTQVASNQRKTWLFLTFFLVLIIGFGWLFSVVYNSSAILIFAVALSLFLNIFSYWYSDKLVLKMAGAKPVEKKDNPELYRIVENLAITAGLPTPKIYIVNNPSPNAFATGRDKNHAAVAVTSGLLQILNKTELEGVLAHELSHIGNRDTLISTIVVVFAGIFTLLADFFLQISFWSGGSRDNRDSGGNFAFVAGLIAAILAPIAATLIQLAISRKREFLADASGALLTRYPEGLISALKKISAGQPMKVSSSIAHLYFESPLKTDMGNSKRTPFLVKIFMTHPPIEDRIKALSDLKV